MAESSKATFEVEKPNNEALNLEIGVASNFPTTTFSSFTFGDSPEAKKYVSSKDKDEKPARILERDRTAVPLDKLVEMRCRDGQTSLLMNMFMLPIMSCLREAQWVIPDDVTGGEKEVQFANDMFTLPPHRGGMTVSIRQVLKQTLLAILEGFSVFEEVYQIPETGPNKGKLVLRKLAHRDSRTIQFRVDETGGFDGVLQIAMKPNGEPLQTVIPKEKVLYYNVRSEENPLYGRSMFETAWYHYDVKVKWYYIGQIAGQFAAVPGRIGTVPQSASLRDVTQFKNNLTNFAFNTSMVKKGGFDVQPFNGNTSFDFLQHIEHHSHLQAKSVLLQFVDSENRPQLIDNGSKDASADIFVQVLQGIMDDIAETWSNHLMPKFIDWNFGSGIYPKFRFGQLTDSDKDMLQTVFGQVMTSSVLNCTPEFVRQVEEKMTDRLGLDVNYEEIRKREEEAAQDAADLAQQQAEAEVNPEDGQTPPDGSQDDGTGNQSPDDSNTDTTALSAFDADVDEIVAMASTIMSTFPEQFEASGYYDD